MLVVRRALDQLVDSQRLSESTILRRTAQLLVYQWTKATEKAGWIGKLGAKELEVRDQEGMVARMTRNFINNLREEIKRLGGGGRG